MTEVGFKPNDPPVPVTFKVKFIFELGILYIIFNKETSKIKN